MDIWFSARQLLQLNALRDMAPYGKPSFQALVERAVESFLETEMQKPGVREKVAQYSAEQPKIVSLRDSARTNSNNNS